MSKRVVFLELLRRDLYRYRREFLGKLFDSSLTLFTFLIVFGYFMTEYGLNNFGPMMLIGAVASFGFFDTVGKIAHLLADIVGDRTISYQLTLPISSRMVFVYIGVYWALNAIMTSIFLFPIGKLILFDQFDLGKISI